MFKNILKNKYKYHGLVLVFAVLVFAFSANNASAEVSASDLVIDPIKFTYDVMYAVLSSISGFLVKLTGITSVGLKYVLEINLTRVSGVKNGWEISQQFANMFFVVALIIMAFATIFGFSKYDYRSLIARLIIIALLINFSLVIGETIIDWFQSLNNVFLRSIEDIGLTLTQELGYARFVTETEPSAAGGGGSGAGGGGGGSGGAPYFNPLDPLSWGIWWGNFLNTALMTRAASASLKWELIQGVLLKIVFQSMLLFSLGVAFVWSFVRIPVLWSLLIVAPIAWTASLLPATRGAYNSWWKYFLAWNVFMPIYLFFLYMAAYFVGQGETLFIESSRSLPGMTGSVTFQTLFFYIFCMVLLIGGAKFAMRSSMAAGAGGIAMATWARGRTMARWTGRLPGRAVRATGVTEAAEQRWKQFKQEGFTGTRFEGSLGKVYGGKEGFDRRKSAIAESFGVRGAAQTQMAKDVEAEKQRLKTVTDLDKLKRMSEEGAEYKRAGALERISELRDLSREEIINGYNLYGGNGSMNARKFIEKIDPKKYTKDERDTLYNSIGDVRFQQKVAQARAEIGDFEDIKAFVTQSTIFTNDADKGEFVRKAADYIKRLRPTERKELYDSSDISKEMRKEIATIRVDADDNVEVDELVNMANLFEAKNQKENLLKKAQEKNFIASLKARAELTLLRDVPDPDRPGETKQESYEDALKREVGRLNNEQILKMSKQALRDDSFRQALKPSLNPNRITSLLRSPNASAEDIATLNPLFMEVRQETLINEKIAPLSSLLDQTKKIKSGMLAARSIHDEQRFISFKKQAYDILQRAKKIVDEVDNSKDVDEFIKQAAYREYTELEKEISRLE